MNNLCLPESVTAGGRASVGFRTSVKANETPLCAVEQFVLRTVHRLRVEYAATSIIQWQATDSEGLVAVDEPASLPAVVLAKTKLLAERALSSGQLQSRTLATGEALQLMATPLPGVRGFAVSVVFSQDASCSDEKANLRCREVELAAAYLSVLRLTPLQSGAADVYTAPEDSPETCSEPTSEQAANQPARPLDSHELSTWRDIFMAIWGRSRSAIGFGQGRVKAVCLVAGGLVLIGLIPFPHLISCKVQCEPATRRFVAAPFDARLLSCEVDVGQGVKQGDVLARLDGSDIRSQLASLQAKLAQSAQRRSAALAQRDASNAEFERLEVQHMQRELEILANRESSLEIRSPIDGIVVSGDLRRSEGATLAVGEPLFEIAPLDGLIAEIAIPEADITYVEPGVPASIALEATPGEWYAAKIARIHPRNELRDNASVYIGEAVIENTNSQLRPGMSGTARVRVGLRPVGWLLFHKPIEALRQLLGW